MVDNGEEESLLGSSPFNINGKESRNGITRVFRNFDCGSKKCLHFFKLFFPILTWLPKYELNWLQCDLIAGLTVGLTVVPQGLAYAQIAGLPVQYGLYSSFMGGFIYCIFGTSKDVTLGPTAIMSLLVYTYGNRDPVQAVLLTLLAGLIQFGMGLFRLGFIMRFVSVPVISGFTSAAAITIALGQLKHIFGVKTTSQDFFPQLAQTLKSLGEANVWDLVMGLSCVIILSLLRYIREWMSPSSPEDSLCQKVSKKLIWLVSIGRNAIVVISAGLVAYAIHTQSSVTHCKHPDCLTLTGKIEQGLPDFKPPSFQETKGNSTVYANELVGNIGVGLIVVPLMGLLESLAIGKAFGRKNGYALDVNQDMIAIGVSNILSSFVSSYCITGSFSRTAINAQSNVKTQIGGIFTGALVLMSLALLTPFFYYIPKSALAAVIICAVVYMIDVNTVKSLWRVKKIDLLPLVTTFLVCFWEIPYGILAGIAMSLIIMLYPSTFPKISDFATINASSESILVITIRQGMYYSSAEYVTDTVREIVHRQIKEDRVDNVVIDASGLTNLDYTCVIGLVELADELARLDIVIFVANLKFTLVETLQSADESGRIRYVSSLDELS